MTAPPFQKSNLIGLSFLSDIPLQFVYSPIFSHHWHPSLPLLILYICITISGDRNIIETALLFPKRLFWTSVCIVYRLYLLVNWWTYESCELIVHFHAHLHVLMVRSGKLHMPIYAGEATTALQTGTKKDSTELAYER